MPGLASLLRGRTTNPRAAAVARRRTLRPSQAIPIGNVTEEWDLLTDEQKAAATANQEAMKAAAQAAYFAQGGPPGGKTGGVVGYQRGGRTVNPRKILTPRQGRPGINVNARSHYAIGSPTAAPPPSWLGHEGNTVGWRNPPPGGQTGGYVGGYQIGGPVGVSPEEVEMASDIYARAAPEQQAQITGGGGGPGMMDEEAAIGEALAMAMGGGGGGPPMNGAPPMGGPPMGGMI